MASQVASDFQASQSTFIGTAANSAFHVEQVNGLSNGIFDDHPSCIGSISCPAETWYWLVINRVGLACPRSRTSANVCLMLYPKESISCTLQDNPALKLQVWKMLNTISPWQCLGKSGPQNV